jgi:hypothetical protein
MKHTLKLMLATVAMLVPMTAGAYVPPDQYIYVDDYGLPPPTARHAQDRVTAQNALLAERRQQQNGTYTTTSGGPVFPSVVSGSGQPGYVVVDPPHNVASDDSALAASLDDLIMSVDDLSATVADLQSRSNRTTRIQPPAPTPWVEPAPWHPLPRSGAGTWVLVALGGIAAFWTLRKVTAAEIA